MSLRSQPEYRSTATPEFEKMESEAATIETTTKEETMNTTTDTASASVQATTAIATAAASSALSTVTTPTKFKLAFVDKNNVFDTATVEGLALAAPALKGEQASIYKGDKELGKKIHFELISFNHRWTVGTGENDKEAKDYFRVSLDNKTISGTGEDLYAYLESLKAQGFNKAKVSPYLDLFGFVVWVEGKGEIPVDERELCRLQCSQTTMGNFTAFCTTRGLLESKGIAKPIDVIEVTAQAQQNKNGDRYTNMTFAVPKP